MIKKLIILFLLFLLPMSTFGATYCVDSAAGIDTNAGTSANGTCSDASPWKTAAKVQVTLTGDQSDTRVLFKTGGRWREQYTNAGNGTAGHPFYHGSYGTGDKPIFDAADLLVTDWTVFPGQKIVNSDFETWVGGTLPGYTTGAAGTSTFSQETTTVHSNSSALKFVVDGSNSDVYVRPPYPPISPSTSYTLSIWHNIPLTKTAKMVVRNRIGGVSGKYLKEDGSWQDESQSLSIPGAGGWALATLTFTSYSSGDHLYILLERNASTSATMYFDQFSLVENGATPNPNAWGYSVADPSATTVLLATWFNGTLGAVKANIASLGANGDWYYDTDANILWVYSSTAANPSTVWTSPGVEFSTRRYAMRNPKSYVTIDGLRFIHATEGITSGQTANITNLTMQNVEADHNFGYGSIVLGYDVGGFGVDTCTISNFNIHDNAYGSGTSLHSLYVSKVTNCTFNNGTLTNNSDGYDIQIVGTSTNNTFSNITSTSNYGFLVIYEGAKTFPTGNVFQQNAATTTGSILVRIAGNYSTGTSNTFSGNTFRVSNSASFILSKANDSEAIWRNNLSWGGKFIDSNTHTSDSNLLGPEATGYISYNGTAYDTLAAYVKATGQDTHSTKSPRSDRGLLLGIR